MIDTSVLSQLFDSEETIRKFVTYFLEDIPKNMDALTDAVQNKDYENAAILSHNIKSQLKYLNEQNSVQIAAEIEAVCDAPNDSNADMVLLLINKLQAELDLIIFKTNEYLK